MPTQHKTKLIDTESNCIEILIGYDEIITRHPPIMEECHGPRIVNQDAVEIKLTSVEIVISGVGVDILPILDDRKREAIIDCLND